MKKKITAGMAEITPTEMRKVVKEGIEKRLENAGQFYVAMKDELNIKVKQRTFEMYVSSEHMRGAGCLIPAYEYFTGKKIRKIGSPTKGVHYIVMNKKKFEQAFPV